MAKPLRKATGLREVSPNVWELFASAGRDPVTGKYRQVSKYFHGTFADAKVERGNFVAQVKKGHHSGTSATVEHLCLEWLKELERKGRSPGTIDEYRRVYYHDIHKALGHVPVAKVRTKMLTDLYGAHQRRGTSAFMVGKIHSTISSMMTQACKWEWRDSNPARWADPPPLPDVVPEAPTPEMVKRLLQESHYSDRPAYEAVILLAATTGMRRGEICALKRSKIDFENATLLVERGIVKRKDPKTGRWVWVERPTKNRKRRRIAVDIKTLEMLSDQISHLDRVATEANVQVRKDAYVFTNTLDGSGHWIPDTVTQYFKRLCVRCGYPDLTFKLLRTFMDTYGQELGFSGAQVSVRAGHDPAVAAKHYTARVAPTDRAIAAGLAQLVGD